MSYQKSKWKIARPSLAKGARGCNYDNSVPETRAEMLARKVLRRNRFHAGAQDHDRITRILAGVRINRLGRRVERHNSLPHQGEREIARRLRQAGRRAK